MTRTDLNVLKMRQWSLNSPTRHVHALDGLIGLLGDDRFESEFLSHLQVVVPAASYSIYRTGRASSPRRFMSASYGIADTTQACWQAYLSGPQRHDQTFSTPAADRGHGAICHITDREIPALHKSLVYEPYGVKERISVIQQEHASIFAINFYRHVHQKAFSDEHLSDLATLGPALLTLVQKQIELLPKRHAMPLRDVDGYEAKLKSLNEMLTPRELDVCARLLMGMTQDAIAHELGLSLATVKTYRNRAFSRLGIHFKSQLFSLLVH
jgi:DNA-binding CsgD family transcriptional regulator